MTRRICRHKLAYAHAFQYFSSVPWVLVPDNLKNGGKGPCFCEMELSAICAEMEEHYNCAVLPVRPRHPQGKNNVAYCTPFSRFDRGLLRWLAFPFGWWPIPRRLIQTLALVIVGTRRQQSMQAPFLYRSGGNTELGGHRHHERTLAPHPSCVRSRGAQTPDHTAGGKDGQLGKVLPDRPYHVQLTALSNAKVEARALIAKLDPGSTALAHLLQLGLVAILGLCP